MAASFEVPFKNGRGTVGWMQTPNWDTAPFNSRVPPHARCPFHPPLWQSPERAQGGGAAAVQRRAGPDIRRPLSEERAGDASAARRSHLLEDVDQEAGGLLQPRGDGVGPHLQEQIQGTDGAFCCTSAAGALIFRSVSWHD